MPVSPALARPPDHAPPTDHACPPSCAPHPDLPGQPARPIRTRPALAHTRAELDALLDDADATPRRPTRAVVMTMGALHAGHAQLIRAARSRADQVIVTVFVNPLQFGANEDFDRYPRMLSADLEVCAAEGADIVFAPTTVHESPPLVRLSAGPLGEVLEGAERPGHFDGMLTLVATMLHLTRPDLAFFGRKDAQQLACIRRMIADLAFSVEIVGVPTVRDPDGLALSSRNAYLSRSERSSALALARALTAGADARADGAAAVLSRARAVLDAEDGIRLDYLALASPTDLGPVEHGPALLLVAARVGRTRLIDNIELMLPDPLATGV